MTNAGIWLSAVAALTCALVMAWRLAQNFRARTSEIVHAYAEALFPPRGPIPVSGAAAGAVGWFERYLARSQPRQRRLVMLLLVFSEYGPVVFGPRRRRFTRLSADEQRAFMYGSFASSIYLRRITILTMRTLFTMAYFASEEVLFHMGMRHDADPFADDQVSRVPWPTQSGERLKVVMESPDQAPRAPSRSAPTRP